MRPTDPISTHFRLKPDQHKALERLGFLSTQDLLMHLPSRYIEGGGTRRIKDLEDGAHATIHGEVTKAETKKTFRGKMPAGELTVRDASGTIRAIWFRQPYIAKMHPVGSFVRLDGVVKKQGDRLSMANPHIEEVAKLPGTAGGTLFEGTDEANAQYPVYPETRGITSRWFFHAIEKVLRNGVHEQLVDPIPSDIIEQYNLPSLSTALVWIHLPKEPKHAESARKRFAFQEIFFLQLKRQEARLAYLDHRAFMIPDAQTATKAFASRFPFPLTPAQERAITLIAHDVSSERPMLRLLEGDVGSGKTAVAASVAAAIVHAKSGAQRLQVAYMCPTEILAEQQFKSFITYFAGLDIPVGLITGSGCFKFPSKVHKNGATSISRAQLLKWVAGGEIPILVGTHALIQKSVKFKHLALVVIDEQHRFGAAQRAKLAEKEGLAPHVLTMTATPIPRTLALTIYGDLDLTLLDAMPPGRKPIMTNIVPPGGREKAYEKVHEELKAGRQVYVICPRIDEPDPEKELAVQAKSVKAEAQRLSEKVFPEYTIDILHSKMTPKEKQETMEQFAKHETDILVATSVVEVGVNVPNATVIIIEGAERFGLAQLHQLRGRVIRGTHQAHCMLFADAKSQKTMDRLKAIVEAKNGFELAERDLLLRGAGELGGNKQWGISDLGMEAIRNMKMVEAARTEATRLLIEDRTLSRYPVLVSRLKEDDTRAHLE